MDKIIVKRLQVAAVIGVDAWERIKAQPLTVTVTVFSNIRDCGATDALDASISYADVAKQVKAHAETSMYRSMESLAYSIIKLCLSRYISTEKVTVVLEKPKGLLHAECPDDNVSLVDGEDILFVRNLALHAVVGVNPWEREDKQVVVLNFQIFTQLSTRRILTDKLSKLLNYRTIVRAIANLVERSSYLTIEALVTSVSRLAISDLSLPRIRISVEKPSALLFAESARIEIERSMLDFPTLEPALIKEHIIYIAFGSNLGERQINIHDALDFCDEQGIDIIDTSFLYESKPMYVTEQPPFLNGVFKAKTLLTPHDLLKVLKGIERRMGRDFSILRNGPRIIDLDILFYDDLEIVSETLTIPHMSIQERAFVLVPLCDIAPHMEHPALFRTCESLSALLKHKQEDSYSLYRVTPVRSYFCKWDEPKTIIMGILNVTPDSFTDGGKYTTDELALSKVSDMILNGAHIVDIGGQSTRPGAEDVTTEEELDRVIPIIEAIRASEDPAMANIPISIDTFRTEVAAKAILAGASLINDVSGGGYGGEEMMRLWKDSRLPVCVMHMRGNSRTMTGLNRYTGNDVIKEVRGILGGKVQKMIALGIRRWNIILDPGIGFAKDAEQNFQMIKNLQKLVTGSCSRMPLLVGVSRKGFIGAATGDTDPRSESRKWGTAGACSAAINSGCHILRVHDVEEMRNVILVADKFR